MTLRCSKIKVNNPARGGDGFEFTKRYGAGADTSSLVPDFRVHPNMMDDKFLGSKTFHLTCGPARCVELVTAIMERRANIDPESMDILCMMRRPIFVWRPLACYCTPSEIPNFYAALKHVDVVSPSFAELFALFGPGSFDKHDLLIRLKDGCNQLLALGFGNKPSAVVVRIGEGGCYVATLQRHTMMPAYHQSTDLLPREQRTQTSAGAHTVVDAVGAGHAFLGGFCIGLLNDPHPHGLTEFEVGGIYGSVAASFAIEQVGLPRLSYDSPPSRKERWNDQAVRDRLAQFERRIQWKKLSEQEQQRVSLYQNIPLPARDSLPPGYPMFQRIRKCEGR